MAPSKFQFIGFLLATLHIAPITQVFAISAKLDVIPPTTTANTDTPIPEDILHELRTLMNVTNEYEIAKRSAQVRYQCGQGEALSRAVCEGNIIVTYCTPNSGRFANRLEWERDRHDCGSAFCADNGLGSNPPKATCRAADAMGYGHLGNGGGKQCSGINAAWAQGQQVRVGVRVFSNVGAKIGYEPEQITLTDGNKKMVQAVGPADIKGGHFISKYFKYIGGIDECVYGKVSFDTPAFTWYTYITSW